MAGKSAGLVHVFGIFEDGDFDIKIPVKETVDEVIVKTRMGERTVWNADTGFVSQSEPYGVFAFDIGKEKMYLTIAEDGRMTEE